MPLVIRSFRESFVRSELRDAKVERQRPAAHGLIFPQRYLALRRTQLRLQLLALQSGRGAAVQVRKRPVQGGHRRQIPACQRGTFIFMLLLLLLLLILRKRLITFYLFYFFQTQDAGRVRSRVEQQKRKRKHQEGTTMATFHSSANVKPLSGQQRLFVLQRRCFLLRNLDKVRTVRDRQKDRAKLAHTQQTQQVAGRSRRILNKSGSGATTTTTTAVETTKIIPLPPTPAQVNYPPFN